MVDAQTITYSPAFTLVPTYECFNRCTYCNFRTDPGENPWLSLEAARDTLAHLKDRGVLEILILSGEVHPHSPRRQDWLTRIEQLCQLALDHGFLPHTNAGPLSQQEMLRLKAVNVSMGLMLEQLTPKLLETVHRHAPSKIPQLRRQQLDWAGELGIPFTTGLLLGIGETLADRQDTLEAIAHCHQRWGHIQEVILQPYVPGSSEQYCDQPFSGTQLVKTVTIARQILPSEITIQIPPNLVEDFSVLLACIEAGARDLGGIVPIDHVNPDYHHQAIAQLSEKLVQTGWVLQPRLPVYPHLIYKLSPQLQAAVQQTRLSSVSACP
jgi:7,8-didemethyl-8-hydroxy-5-deazariboflavin synthase